MISLPIVLAIAGSDSSAGAGIQADLKTISACGGYGRGAGPTGHFFFLRGGDRDHQRDRWIARLLGPVEAPGARR